MNVVNKVDSEINEIYRYNKKKVHALHAAICMAAYMNMLKKTMNLYNMHATMKNLEIPLQYNHVLWDKLLNLW